MITIIPPDMNYKRLLFLWLLIVMFSGGILAQVYTDNLVRSFKISDKSSVEVSNKYGKVHVRTWEKDSVRFEVSLKILTTSSQKLQKLKNQISFDFTSTNYYIVAKTSFNKTGGIFSDVVETIVPSNDVRIDYVVYIPKTTLLKIENKFGDVYIDDFNGNLGLVLSNGNLKANYLKGNTSIYISSGSGEINKIDRGKIETSYADLEIKEANNIQLETRFSEVEILSVINAEIDSKRDKYIIANAKKIVGTGNFTKFDIEKLTSSISFSNKYYGINIENISSGFNFVNLTSEYTDIDLVFEKNTSYKVDITHGDDVNIIYPIENSNLQTKELNNEEKLMLTFGQVGKNIKADLPNLKIVAEKKCYINIKYKK